MGAAALTNESDDLRVVVVVAPLVRALLPVLQLPAVHASTSRATIGSSRLRCARCMQARQGGFDGTCVP